MEPTIPEVVPQIPEVKKDNHWVTILAMALFVLASLSVVAFLYYQNQALKKMLAVYQVPVSSPTPTAMVDPTANWKTYINTKYQFNFKFPDQLSVVENPYHSNASVLDLNIKADESPVIQLQITPMSIKDLKSVTIGILGDQKTSNLNINGVTMEKITGFGGIGGSVSTTAVYFKNNNLTYMFISGPTNDSLDQILSTFRFIDPPEASAKEDKFLEPTSSPSSN